MAGRLGRDAPFPTFSASGRREAVDAAGGAVTATALSARPRQTGGPGGGRRLGVPPLPLPDPAGARAPPGGGRGPAAAVGEDLLSLRAGGGVGGRGSGVRGPGRGRANKVSARVCAPRLCPGVLRLDAESRFRAGKTLTKGQSDAAAGAGVGPRGLGGQSVAGTPPEGRDRVGVGVGWCPAALFRAARPGPAVVRWRQLMGVWSGLKLPSVPPLRNIGAPSCCVCKRANESPHVWSLRPRNGPVSLSRGKEPRRVAALQRRMIG
ncbi:protein argonaute 14-like [Lynx canadensis]|uniref:protein argonaute 14-like n=1 Tax=Lynx canadensis TaxID=61383 RepID=UPI0011B0A4F4|nr:protein argonaute 14-like [Lynx canadensis]